MYEQIITIVTAHGIFKYISLPANLLFLKRHQLVTFPALLALCERNLLLTGGFPSQRPVTQSFDVFIHLPLNKRLSKQSKRRWFETPLLSLWRHRNDIVIPLCWATLTILLAWYAEYIILYSSSHTSATLAVFRMMAVQSAPGPLWGLFLRNTWPTCEQGTNSKRPPHIQIWYKKVISMS